MKEHRLVGAFALLILTLCITGVAQAQTRVTDCDPATPNNALCITTVVTKFADGTPITEPLTYRFEQKTGSTWIVLASGVTVPRYYVKSLAPGTYTFRTFSNCATCTAESGASNEASGNATAIPKVPGIPVTTIAVVISAERAPVFKIASNGVSIGSTLYGLVPVGRECGAKIATWRGVSINRVAVQPSEVWPKGTSTNNLAAPCG